MFSDEFLAQGLHLKSHQRCSAGIRTWLSADQSSSSVNNSRPAGEEVTGTRKNGSDRDINENEEKET